MMMMMVMMMMKLESLRDDVNVTMTSYYISYRETISYSRLVSRHLLTCISHALLL